MDCPFHRDHAPSTAWWPTLSYHIHHAVNYSFHGGSSVSVKGTSELYKSTFSYVGGDYHKRLP